MINDKTTREMNTTDTTDKFVAYYRVSTKRQGASGLSLDAQRLAVANRIGSGALVGEFTEIESGRKNNRAELNTALAACKRSGATLIIAKLDRLSRNAAFIMALAGSGVSFVVCDMPSLTTLTIGIYATIAQHEAEITSQRTKDALAAKKAQGFKLGNPNNLSDAAKEKGKQAIKQAANESTENKAAAQLIENQLSKGATLAEIATLLNSLGYATRRGGSWHASSVRNVANRFGFGKTKSA